MAPSDILHAQTTHSVLTHAASCRHFVPFCSFSRIDHAGFQPQRLRLQPPFTTRAVWPIDGVASRKQQRLLLTAKVLFACDGPARLSNGLLPSPSTDEHDTVQKKTFTKWINAQLSKVMGTQKPRPAVAAAAA